MTVTDEQVGQDGGSTRERAAPGRIAALDLLRGIAILGTLGTNIWLFTSPGGAAAWLAGWGGGPTDAETWLTALSNGKFLALLTLLFGIGMELQYRSAVRRGLRWPGRYLLRALVLLAEGFVHYVLVFEFDVLMGYAIASMIVAFLVGRSELVVRTWAGVVGGIYVAAILGLTALMIAFPEETGSTPSGPPAYGSASWPDQVQARLTEMGVYRIELILIVPSAVVLFLVGSRLVRAGLFTATASGARLRNRLAWVGLGAGVPLNALTTWAGPDWSLVDRYLVPPLVALGILALGTSLVARSQANRPGLLRRGLESVGRTALTCYVLQNVLASWLCYDWGLGLADGSVVRTIALWTGISALLMVLAPLWLRYWSRGPIEIVMHRLTGGNRGA
ncbi:DUF418 domain-containing protein [Myceligenerans crystallogenes]|uniref:DUF418 domain-containing protein n=1 Tax=Myceligenerans crystallogenes TaxID=316335 RepID=A0ABP4ZHD1_9MICO